MGLIFKIIQEGGVNLGEFGVFFVTNWEKKWYLEKFLDISTYFWKNYP